MSGERITSAALRSAGSGEQLVVLHTDAGRTGMGELVPRPGLELGAPTVAALTVLLAGRDPSHVTAAVTAASNSADASVADPVTIAAVTTAMLDLNARRLGVPLSRLLAGPVRHRIPVCAVDWAPNARDVGAVAAAARSTVAAGFTTLRVDVAHLDGPAARAAMVAAVRDAVPGDVQVVVRGGDEIGTRDSLRLLEELRPFDVLWFEQAAMVPTGAAMHRLADRTPITLAAGRGCRPELLDTLAAAGQVDHIVLEPGTVGGLYSARRLAALAEIHHTHVIAAGSGGPVSLTVALQLAAAIPNLTTLEVVPGQLAVVDGTVHVDLTPGVPHSSDITETVTNPGGAAA